MLFTMKPGWQAPYRYFPYFWTETLTEITCTKRKETTIIVYK